MDLQVGILVIGSEILDGRTCDTNSHWLELELNRIGVKTSAVLVCDDELKAIVESVEFLLARCRCVIISGGLGPTGDDLTREALAVACGRGLCLNTEALQGITAWFGERNRPFPKINERQALFPEGAEVLPNPIGSAPAFLLRLECADKSKILFALPGVPAELQEIFTRSVKPMLEDLLKTHSCNSVSLWIFGKSEAEVAEAVESAGIDPCIKIAYRVSFPEVQLMLSAGDREILRHASELALSKIGAEFVVSQVPEFRLPQVVHELLCKRELSISVAESCTGGMLGELLTANPGSSRYFVGGVVSYSNTVKSSLLGVDMKTLSEYGACLLYTSPSPRDS